MNPRRSASVSLLRPNAHAAANVQVDFLGRGRLEAHRQRGCVWRHQHVVGAMKHEPIGRLQRHALRFASSHGLASGEDCFQPLRGVHHERLVGLGARDFANPSRETRPWTGIRRNLDLRAFGVEAVLGRRRDADRGSIVCTYAKAVVARDLEADPAAAGGNRDPVSAGAPVAPALEAVPYVSVACIVGNGRGCLRPDAIGIGIGREYPRKASPFTTRENLDPFDVRVDQEGGLRGVDGGGLADFGTGPRPSAGGA